jgi:5'-nucleotidase
MYILVTNDDGLASPGLLALYHAMREVGDAVVIAPERNWSAASASRTFYDPIRVDPTTMSDGSPAYVCNGTPGDCVALAALGVLEHRPDLVVSGINLGANLGQDVSYSGTVAAGMEGVGAGIPAIAFSQYQARRDSDFVAGARFAAKLAREVLERGVESGILLNVNIPPGAVKGVAVTRLGHRHYADELIVRHDPRGRPYYWIGGGEPEGSMDEGTDTAAIANDFISVTPIHYDLTHPRWIEELHSWNLDME